MNNRDLQNKELDRIGRKLLNAAKVRDEEIEEIVSSPMLFESIKLRIESEQRERNSKNVPGELTNLRLWNWHKVSSMTLLLFIIGIISLIITGKLMPIEQTTLNEPETKPKVERIESQSLQINKQIPKDLPAIVKTKNSLIKYAKFNKSRVSKDKFLSVQKSKLRITKQRPGFQPKQIEFGGEFYALAFNENPLETGQELRIIRAELSRSSLFALGVNLSIENESEKIKTDLLVGADGVARAIRLVNKTENQ